MLKEILESRSLELPNDYQDWSGFLSELESSLIVHLGSTESAYCLHGRVAQWLFDSLKPVADPGLRTPLNSLSPGLRLLRGPGRGCADLPSGKEKAYL